MTSLQLATVAILEHASAYEWSVQGFGMLRLYIRDIGRLHIWDDRLRYPNVSMVHNHSWDLRSTVVNGLLVNTRFQLVERGGERYSGQRLITGYQTKMVARLADCLLQAEAPEVYQTGATYSQSAFEIHRTDADNGTITIMARKEDEQGQADVYWLANTEWGTAKPRAATPEEVTVVVEHALAKLK
jgi:hypothetical protein